MSIYFIRSRALRAVKIGYSSKPRHRLSQLKVASPVALELVAIMPGDRAVERQLHDRFADSRKAGEWFAESRELAKLIKEFRWAPPARTRKPDRFDRLAAKGNVSSITAARLRLRLSQTELAKALGYGNPSAVCRMENGSRAISPRTILALEALIERQRKGVPLPA